MSSEFVALLAGAGEADEEADGAGRQAQQAGTYQGDEAGAAHPEDGGEFVEIEPPEHADGQHRRTRQPDNRQYGTQFGLPFV